ncbi:restriction endonuclease [Rhizobium sp. P40RR-XXII]|uniref:restriction endonuclease n=1 Tax=unclassified Rhizobium TaxID=2613769 RepID=UPI001456F33B|nr:MULTISPECIES: restriction endonuclease [unclassified Rhizobium]NLR83770.1 restriction endonuclease [Rhizobium sp. P28RR-XV]NLS16189.1 restriction endonuclease [Rhizobium sp. P40RR-XXII]
MSNVLKGIEKPSKWPNANARLLGVGLGLPVDPLDRLGTFSPDEFERFVLEWADGYLAEKVPGVSELQPRGGAGDKGRDIVVWFGKPGDPDRYWHLYQCKRYSSALGEASALGEIGKVLYFASRGDFIAPREYWFVARKGVTGGLQDLLD